MKTSNFDLLFEIKEDLINKALAIAFYTSAFPTIINGKVAISKKLTAGLKSIGDICFEMRLKEPPTVDAIQENSILMLLNLEFIISVLNGISNKFEITASLTVIPKLLPATQHIVADLSQALINEIIFNDRNKIPSKTVKAMDEVIKGILKSQMLDKMEDVDLTPFLKTLSLPDPASCIDAVIPEPDGKALFFKGASVINYSLSGNGSAAGNPVSLSTRWKDIWPDGIDAALVHGGYSYFFRNEKYIRYHQYSNTPDPGYPALIKDGWKGLWTDGIDAAVIWNDGKAYFFKGHEFIRYDFSTGSADDGYPMDIALYWPGIWPDGIDTVMLGNNGKAYFFKGDEYIYWNVAGRYAEPGYPAKINDKMPGILPGKLPVPVDLGGFKTMDQRVLTLGLNIFDNPLGNMEPVKNYVDENDLWIGTTEKAMIRIFDHVWCNTAYHIKRRHWSGSYDVIPAKALDYINKFNELLGKIVPNILSLGFVSTNIRVDYLKCDASATVSLNKPSFELLPGNKIEIKEFRVDINIYLHVYTKFTVITEIDANGWLPNFPHQEDIINTSSTEIDLINGSFSFNEGLKDIEAELICDLTKGISARITNIKVDFDLGIDLISDACNWLMNSLTGLILPLVPTIRLLPPLIEKEIEVSAVNKQSKKNITTLNIIDYVVPDNLTFKVEPGPVTIDDKELTAATRISLVEMPRKIFSMPLFVANCNPKRMEVHRLDCDWVEKIDQAYRIGYYVLNDAIHDGFDGCKYCLTEYHTR